MEKKFWSVWAEFYWEARDFSISAVRKIEFHDLRISKHEEK